MRNTHVKEALKVIAEEKEKETGTIFLNVMDLHHIPPEIEFLPHLNKVKEQEEGREKREEGIDVDCERMEMM